MKHSSSTHLIFWLGIVALVAISSMSSAESKPEVAEVDSATLEVRANEAIARADYQAAVTPLRTLQQRYQGEPEKLGPVEEKIRLVAARLAEKAGAGDPTNPQAGAQAGPPSNEERKPHAKPTDGEVLELGIQDLGNFQFDQDAGGNIPADVRALTGQTVRLRGFMIPLDQADKIRQFVLVPDLFACCFGQPPQVQHSIIVTCPEGKAVSYFPDEIQIEGKLNVEEKKDDGFIVSIFDVVCSSVKPAPK